MSKIFFPGRMKNKQKHEWKTYTSDWLSTFFSYILFTFFVIIILIIFISIIIVVTNFTNIIITDIHYYLLLLSLLLQLVTTTTTTTTTTIIIFIYHVITTNHCFYYHYYEYTHFYFLSKAGFLEKSENLDIFFKRPQQWKQSPRDFLCCVIPAIWNLMIFVISKYLRV